MSKTTPSARALAQQIFHGFWMKYILDDGAPVLTDEQIIERITGIIESAMAEPAVVPALREALEQYADPTNWKQSLTTDAEPSGDNNEWIGYGDHGWSVAQLALAQLESAAPPPSPQAPQGADK